MRSILFSLTLVFFTGCLTEATPDDITSDNPDEVGDVATDSDQAGPTDDQPSRDPARDAIDRELKLQLVQEGAPWGMSHQRGVQPDYTPPEPDCTTKGKPLDPRCKHPH